MNNLLTRTLAVVLVAVLSFALVTALVIRIGFQNSLSDSDKKNNETLVAFIRVKLESLPLEERKDATGQTALAIAELLRDLPVRTEYVVVLNQKGKLLYYARGDKSAHDEAEWHNLKKRLIDVLWHEVPSSGMPRFRFAARTLRVDAEQSSRFILSVMLNMAALGAIAACVIAGILAYVLSRPLSRQAKRLAAGLSGMKNGRRDVELPKCGVKELREIASSAAGLQDTLRKEEAIRLQWTADIAHDLRTPLTVLKGQFEGMLDGVLPTDRARVEKNYHEILTLERLINQLADLTRMESPGYTINYREIDAAELIRAQAQRFVAAGEARGIGIIVSVDPRQPASIRADAALLERALANLIDNAIRHGDPHAELRLGFAVRPGRAVFVVDSAGLVDAADRPHLFDRLFRGDRSRSTDGSGLGLSIVQAIARAHGGSVSFECDEDSGRTRFELSLPI